MNAKKNSSHELEGKRATVFTIGLLAAGSFTLAAFTYVSPLEVEEAKLTAEHAQVEYFVTEEQDQPEEIVETAQTEDVQQSTTELVAEIREEITKTESSNKKVESGTTSEGLTVPHGEFDITIKRKKVKAGVYDYPDEEATWIGGEVAMFKYIAGEQEYPEEAIFTQSQGRIYVEFIVEENGSISSITTKGKGDIHPSLKAEARRIVQSFPKWQPGTVGGLNVRTRVRLPINFVLE